MQSRTLTLVATYNEVENIARLVPEILRCAPDTSVLVVDDDSPDGTAAAVERIAARNPAVAVMRRTGERGYGSAMAAGLQHAIAQGFEHVVTLDADFSHDPEDIPRLIAALGSADVAIGSRYFGGVRVVNWQTRRLLLSLAANAYVRLLSGLTCVDCTSGFRAYRTRALREPALTRIRTAGYAFLPELLFNLGEVRIVEVPICYTERREGESKMSRNVIAEAVIRPWGLLLRRLTRHLR